MVKRIDPQLAAVLIDGENVGPQYLPFVEELLKDYRRDARLVYGDWVRPDISPWRPVAETHGYRLVQVTRLIQGKSSVDQRITIDAIDILNKQRCGTICIVTNDTDFAPLLHRLREANIHTILVGDQRAPPGLRSAAHRFEELPSVVLATQATITVTDSVTLQKGATLESLRPQLDAAFDETQRNGIAHLGALGAALKKRLPAFKPKDYGEKRLLDIFTKLASDYSVLTEEQADKSLVHYVRRKEA